MHVIFHAADQERWAFENFRNGSKLGMEAFTNRLVAKKRPAFLGGENKMNVNGGKRLWHAPEARRRGLLAQEDRCAPGSSIPKGLRNKAQGCDSQSNPGYGIASLIFNPNGVAASVHRQWRARRNPVGVEMFV